MSMQKRVKLNAKPCQAIISSGSSQTPHRKYTFFKLIEMDITSNSFAFKMNFF